MAEKITVASFIQNRLGGASQYSDSPELQAMLTAYLDRAIQDADEDLSVYNTTFDALTERGQGIYNRVVGNLVWQTLRQGVRVDDEDWDSDAFRVG